MGRSNALIFLLVLYIAYTYAIIEPVVLEGFKRKIRRQCWSTDEECILWARLATVYLLLAIL